MIEQVMQLANQFEIERARQLCRKCLTEYVTRAVLDPPANMESDIAILITLVKEFSDKPPSLVIPHIQGMSLIGSSLAGKVFVDVLRNEE